MKNHTFLLTGLTKVYISPSSEILNPTISLVQPPNTDSQNSELVTEVGGELIGRYQVKSCSNFSFL